MTTELTFDVTQEADGGHVAEAVGEDTVIPSRLREARNLLFSV